MVAFVLVPGARHGGWWFGPAVEALRSSGPEWTVHDVDSGDNLRDSGPQLLADLLLGVVPG